MANYPQLDDARGVWKLHEVYDAVMGGYWPNANNRAIAAGGFTPSYTSTIEHFNMAASGNSTFFGDLSNSRGEFGTMSNFTRCIFAGGNSAVSPNSTNIIDYVQFNTTGNAADFGDLGAATYRSTGTGGNATRGIVTEGNSDGNQLQYITPSALGNAIDFGDRTVSGTFVAGVTSPTRTCFGGAFTPSVSNIIDFVEIATTGNAVAGTFQGNAWNLNPGNPTTTNNIYVAAATVTQTNSTGNFAVTDSWDVSVHAAKVASDGDDGKAHAQGLVYHGASASAPAGPDADGNATFTFSNGTFTNLDSGWSTTAPTADPTSSNPKFWTATYNAKEKHS